MSIFKSIKIEDASTATQKATVSAAGAIKVDNSAVTQPVSGTVTANAGTNLNTSLLALAADQGKFRGATSGLTTWKEVDGQPRVCSQSYYDQIAEGNVTGHTPWSKIGFNPAITTAMEDIWSAGGLYVFPTAADGWDVVSSSAEDAGTVIHSGTADAGGSTTTIVKAGENFLTTTAVGDCVILDKSGTTPEWGYITSVDSDTQITCSGGFSSGGTGASRAYSIVDQSVATNTGAQAVKIEYLDGSYVSKSEIVIMNGTTPVNTVNVDMFRVNSFRVIAAGSTYATVGNVSLRLEGGAATTYSYISAGYTRARNTIYTVPSGKTLYIFMWQIGASTNNDTKVQTARIMTRANREPSTGFLTGNMFFGYTEMLITNESGGITFPIPTKLLAKTDIRVSAIGLTGFNGSVTSVLRGWLE